MANIMFFNIPAHGHTNPTIEVVRELTARGHRVRYYSFSEFREKIEKAGAEFVCCDDAMPAAPGDLDRRVGRDFALLMEMVTDVTANLHERIAGEITAFKPDCIVSDSVCIWGKLFARRFGVPLVCSTTTLAYNEHTAGLMKQSALDMLRMLTGMPRAMKRLGRLEALGYASKNALALLANDNETDTIVYTSARFQPMAETFSERVAFVGPSVVEPAGVKAKRERPLVYISLGTVMNRKQKFYMDCVEALRGAPWDAVLSVGSGIDMAALGELPENVRAYPHVNQMEVLAEADVFCTHCGMNSTMESLYMGVPMVMYPQQAEERSVADRAAELGTGIRLRRTDARGIRTAIEEVLENRAYKEAAVRMRADLRTCGGAKLAAELIEKTAKREV